MANNPIDVRDDILELPGSLELYHGDSLPRACVAYRIEGPANAPTIAVLGGISSHRAISGREGWWGAMVGPGLAIDTRRWRVLGIDYLGGRGASTNPGVGEQFPPVSAYDQAQILKQLIDYLAVPQLRAIVGASYGGNVALCFAERFADQVEHLLILSAADKSQVLSTAWRTVQRQIVREAIARGDGASGLKLARALAMATYRSAVEFSLRFGGAPVRDGAKFRFPIEDYLFARGDDYVQRYRAENFLALSESIDLHNMDATKVITPATLIAVREDQLVPFADMQALSARLSGPRQLIEINSIFGHDAFLKEAAALTPIFKQVLLEPQT